MIPRRRWLSVGASAPIGQQPDEQYCGTSLTHCASHVTTQQYGSWVQSERAQSEQNGTSAGPAVHTSCAHVSPPLPTPLLPAPPLPSAPPAPAPAPPAPAVPPHI